MISAKWNCSSKVECITINLTEIIIKVCKRALIKVLMPNPSRSIVLNLLAHPLSISLILKESQLLRSIRKQKKHKIISKAWSPQPMNNLYPKSLKRIKLLNVNVSYLQVIKRKIEDNLRKCRVSSININLMIISINLLRKSEIKTSTSKCTHK
mgnify:CR=1 FL=1